ncbi:hypothetical protein LJK87_19685 [Paenibacillus sp. P25]|nr:hypothetical protein LJK87_19685 [Paenibacillus sp. P25]
MKRCALLLVLACAAGITASGRQKAPGASGVSPSQAVSSVRRRQGRRRVRHYAGGSGH